MKYDMVMPQMGESITEGTVIKWLKSVGDKIEKDEIILEISTDKVDSEIPTPVAGTLSEILVNEGDTVEVGSVIARIETGAEEAAAETAPIPAASETKHETKPEPVAAAPAPQPAESKPAPPPAAEAQNARFYSPVVLNIARTEGLGMEVLETIPGTGINNRLTKKDLLNYLETRKTGGAVAAAQPSAKVSAAPAAAADGVEIVPMDHIRKKIAEHMVHTVHTSPHVGLFVEVDMSNIVAARNRAKNEFLRREGIKLTFMPFISEATTKALKEFPLVNASIDGDNILIKHFINLGIAVAADQGLIVPVIKNADSLNLTGFARAINDLATRARSKKLKPDEVAGGTFSISNFGVYGTKIGFPLINQPQLAILGVGAMEKRAVVINDAIAIRPMMDVSLTFDHRLIDGAMGAQFLQRLKELLESYDPNTGI